MENSQELKKTISKQLGVSPTKLFWNDFYRALNGDLTSGNGFPNQFGTTIVAPDWDNDPSISCGKGLHL